MDEALRAKLVKCLESKDGSGAYQVVVEFKRSGGTLEMAYETRARSAR